MPSFEHTNNKYSAAAAGCLATIGWIYYNPACTLAVTAFGVSFTACIQVSLFAALTVCTLYTVWQLIKPNHISSPHDIMNIFDNSQVTKEYIIAGGMCSDIVIEHRKVSGCQFKCVSKRIPKSEGIGNFKEEIAIHQHLNALENYEPTKFFLQIYTSCEKSYTMEFFSHYDLHHAIYDDSGFLLARKRKSKAHRQAKIIDQLRLAVAFLHKRDLVHTDLKPENILINKDATIKLIDLGETHGTAVFLPPEELDRTKRQTSPGLNELKRRDRWSLGATIWEVIALSSFFDNTIAQFAKEKGNMRILKNLDSTKKICTCGPILNSLCQSLPGDFKHYLLSPVFFECYQLIYSDDRELSNYMSHSLLTLTPSEETNNTTLESKHR